MDRIAIRFTVRYVFLLIGISGSIVAAILYSWAQGWTPSLDSILKILGLGVGATSAIYAALSLGRVFDSHVETLAVKRREFSAELMEHWFAPDTAAQIKAADALVQKIGPLSDKETEELLKNEESERYACIAMLNFFEHLSTTLKYELADEVMLKEFYRGVAIFYFSKLKKLIELRRRTSSNQRIFSGFESLANRWSK